jgi:hypothetical protein
MTKASDAVISNHKRRMILGVGMSLTVAVGVLIARPAASALTGCVVTAAVTPTKSTILPGQPVDLVLALRNISGAPTAIGVPSELVGNVVVRIIDVSAPTVARRYVGPSWGLDDRDGPSFVQLTRAGSTTLPLRVLYQDQRGGAPETTIVTPFALSTPGDFSLRVTFADSPECPQPGAAATTTVHVTTPTGNDLAVWNTMRSCVACAQILHTQQTTPGNTGQSTALSTLQSLLNRYPRSGYARLFRKTIRAIDSQRP